ncbi:BRO-N domain-containing protein [Enterococcus gallinarum]|uniref:BRO-N domain-containing protein n=1 Tax=Enterococcus gallinarum TaxID=1353 RepID=UPI001AD60A7B|nr:Bro-N domain-containing protein [Enterococcus gallinarum]MBO6419912.1 phage repressor protein [Enterococcus gallinarum]MBO6423568.1 phage repressor protein [Enterococcus gallinarum]
MKTEIWNGHRIRFVNINGEWWAVAKDVTNALAIRNNRDAIKKLDSEDKGVATIDTLGGKQEFTIIAETGIYELIFKSRKQEAKAFKKWIKSVIKELRQSTGLEGFQVFRMLDKEHQKAAMQNLKKSLRKPVRVDFIKANAIVNKAR